MMACSNLLITGNSVFSDLQLANLKKDLRSSRKSAYASGSLKNLRIQWRSYLSFCIYFDIPWMPATAESLCLFAQFLSRSCKSIDTIRNYISGVKLLHILVEAPCPTFSNIELKMSLRGIARKNPHCPRQAAPITPHILLKIYHLLDHSNPIHSTIWALFITAFFTLSRKSNLVVSAKIPFNPEKQLCRKDITIGQHTATITFRWTKTIQFGNRILKIPLLAIPHSHLCPVKALKAMIKLVPAEPLHPAFAIPCKKSVVPIHYSGLQSAIKTCIKAIGLNPKKFSSHSFRRGGATWAFRSNVPADLIKVQGDWASQAYMRYLDFSLDQRVIVAQNMISEITKITI